MFIHRSKFALTGAVVILLTACADTTPPGKLKDIDFVSRTVEIQSPVPQAVSTFYEGLRYCGPFSGGVFSTTFLGGVPTCSPPRSDGTVVCDVIYGSYILGRADFTPTSRGTSAVLRVRAEQVGKEFTINAWERFLHGEAKRVCPD